MITGLEFMLKTIELNRMQSQKRKPHMFKRETARPIPRMLSCQNRASLFVYFFVEKSDDPQTIV